MVVRKLYLGHKINSQRTNFIENNELEDSFFKCKDSFFIRRTRNFLKIAKMPQSEGQDFIRKHRIRVDVLSNSLRNSVQNGTGASAECEMGHTWL